VIAVRGHRVMSTSRKSRRKRTRWMLQMWRCEGGEGQGLS
jgi:hypothetical protein